MSLFGNTQNQQQGSSLFGGNTNQQGTSSLFGNTQNTSNQQQQGGGLFGNTTNQQQQGTSSLFGGSQQQQGTSSLFGAKPAQQQPGNTISGSAPGQFSTFTSSIGPNQGTGNTQPNQSNALNPLGASTPQDLAAQRLQASGIHNQRNEKKTFEQVQTLVRKWDPRSQDTVLQSYLYNAVSSAYAPFYYRNVDEDEKEWEEALRNKPLPVKGDGEDISFVPVLVRGFRALGERVEFQAKTVNEMRARLHEMNNSLNAIMAKHQQSLAVRLANTHRAHTALAQRTLRLAVKVQVLRSRGFALDAAEETLRKSLLALEKQTFDGSFVAREEEIWARMVQLRERARWLEEEGKRLGEATGEGKPSSGESGGGVPEEVVVQTKRILRDYDGQIRHLGKELEEVRKEFEEWEAKK